MKTRVSSEMNLTNGNLFKKILKFSLPLMLTSIFQLLYTTIDLWTVSNFGEGSISMSSIGCDGSVINLIITLLINMSIGSGVTISIAKGANDKQKAERILHTSYIIAIVGGICFAFLGYFIAPKLLVLMDTPEAFITKATTYLQIYFLGFPFLAILNFASQMLRALGDSKRPMWILTISGLFNVAFDLLFVIAFDLDVAGVAMATVLSWILACVLLTLWFAKSNTVFANFSFKKLKVSKKELGEILKIGLPAGLQGVTFCIPNLLIQSSLYTIVDYTIKGVAISTEEVVVGASASGQIEGYIFVITDAFCIANVSFTGQNLGARKKNNIIKCYFYSLIWIAIFWIGCMLVGGLLYKQLFSIFINDSTEGIIKSNAISAGFERLKILLFTYMLNSIMDLSGCYLKGMKKSLPPAIITLIGCTIFRIVFLYTIFKMPYFHTVFWLYAAFPFSWFIVDLVYIPVLLTISKKQFKLLETTTDLYN